MIEIPRLGSSRESGFSLIELMITVALIGVLASIAIPNFLSYQARTRRSEAFTTLSGIATTYTGFHAEKGYYPDMIAVTGRPNLPFVVPAPTKTEWEDGETDVFFDIVGFQLDGDVWHTYNVSAPDNGVYCTCTNCFTATAWGDTDGNGAMGAVMYAHPQRDASGSVTGWCNESLFGNAPPAGKWDEPAVNFALDQY